MAQSIKIMVDDVVVARMERVDVGDKVHPSVYGSNARVSDTALTQLDRNDRFAVATLAWQVAMSATAIDEVTPDQRRAILAYWSAKDEASMTKARALMHTGMAGDSVIEMGPRVPPCGS